MRKFAAGMRKLWITGVAVLLLFLLSACGGAEQSPAEEAAETEAPAAAPTAAAIPTDTPVPATEAVQATEEPTMVAAQEEQPEVESETTVSAKLQAYADENANGPGAIFVGDFGQLAGPAPEPRLGDFDGNVPLEAIEKHAYIFESQYYQSVLERANLENPTPLVTEGEEFEIQYACINRALLWCALKEDYMFPRVLERTNGQLKLVTTSFPELGLAGPDVHSLVADGTLAMADIAQYIAGAFPAIEIGSLFGIYPTLEHNYIAMAHVTPELSALAVEATEGGQYISLNWHSGNNVFFFSKDPLDTVEAWQKKKIRTPTAAMSSWLGGMEADAQFMAFTEVYTALERGILDAAMTGGDAGFGQRWYEVTDYINGPVISWDNSAMVMNKNEWAKLPEDLQKILLEEAALNELEELRTAAVQHEQGLIKNTTAGLTYRPFSPELQDFAYQNAVLGALMPEWVKRVGGADQPVIDVFNEKIGPIVGMKVNPDGTAVEAPITQPLDNFKAPQYAK